MAIIHGSGGNGLETSSYRTAGIIEMPLRRSAGTRTKKNSKGQAVHLVRHLRSFSKVRILVIGDVMLDHYIWGRVERISPEAPVPVVAVTNESMHLGGAANVARNIFSLGGKVDLCGVIGDDPFGQRILHEMRTIKLGVQGLIVQRGHSTTKKTRVIAHGQQIVRFDREQPPSHPEGIERDLLRYVRRRIRSIDGVIVSDYAKGVITGGLLSELIPMAQEHGLPVIVDPKVSHMTLYKGADIITPNRSEALAAAGIADGSDQGLLQAGRILLKRMNCRAIVITCGEQGMSLFEKNNRVSHIPAVAREVYDVTGAGDTVVGTLALSLCGGADIHEAVHLANYAAGIVVGTVGTATVPQASLARYLRVTHSA